MHGRGDHVGFECGLDYNLNHRYRELYSLHLCLNVMKYYTDTDLFHMNE